MGNSMNTVASTSDNSGHTAMLCSAKIPQSRTSYVPGALSEIHSALLKKENYLKGKSPLDSLFKKENGGGAKG